MARHTKLTNEAKNGAAKSAGGAGKRGGVLAFGAFVLGAGLWLAPAANAEELVQLALLDLENLEALSDRELGDTRGTGADAPEVDAAISDQFAVILWDETKRQGAANTGNSSGSVTVSVRTVEN